MRQGEHHTRGDGESSESLLRRAQEVERSSFDVAEFDAVISALRQALAQTPGFGREFGPWLRRLSDGRGRVERGDVVRWVSLGGGALAIGHRPRLDQLAWLRARGATHVLTLLSESEGALTLRCAVEEAGLDWLWLAMDSGSPPEVARDAEFERAFHELDALLSAGAQVFVHCSAGIHRTGMVTYAYLRHAGHDAESADALLGRLRAITAGEVGPQRRAWGERFAR